MFSIKRMISLALAFVLMALSLPVPALAADNVYFGIGYVTMEDQCLYSKPSPQAQVLDVTRENDCVIIVKETDECWYQVIYNDQTGYMYSGILDVRTEENVELGYGRINPGVAYLRSGPGTKYTIAASGYKGELLYVLGLYNGWYKLLKDDFTCYIRSDLMTLTEIPCQNAASESLPLFYYLGLEIGEITFQETVPVAIPVNGGTLLSMAQNYIGTPYLFGGYSPAGFDCSGLIYYCLTQLEYPCERTAAGQFNMGIPVSRGELKAGDLVFFENTYTSGVSHVGIYAGGNRFLHAPNDNTPVSYSSLSGYWADHYCGARRLG